MRYRRVSRHVCLTLRANGWRKWLHKQSKVINHRVYTRTLYTNRLHFPVFPQSLRGFRTTSLAFHTILGYVATVACTSGCKHRHLIYTWWVNFSKYKFFQLLTKVWPGLTAFPDFTDPGTQAYWEQMLSKFREIVEFDGLWIDMNEPSNELDGSTKGCPANSPLDHPPYKTHVSGDNLYSRTLCMSAKHHSYSHYDVHSLYGLTEMEQTMRYNITSNANMIFIPW